MRLVCVLILLGEIILINAIIYKNGRNIFFYMSVTSGCFACFFLSVCFCRDHFVMVLLNLTYLLCLQHLF